MPLSKAPQRPALSPRPDAVSLFDPQRTWVMGVVNATPDSFFAPSRAQAASGLDFATRLIEEGADVLDLGGESTRPGALTVPADEEARRLLPLLHAVKQKHPSCLVSIDTQKADIARQTLEQGADLINDISALRSDPAMADVLAETQRPVVLMHMQGTPHTMQKDPRYDDVVQDITAFFEERLSYAVRKGISESRVILDPGIGFGKTLEHNLAILRRLKEFKRLGRPLLIGVSRKTFIGKLLAQPEILPPEERLEGSLAAALWAVEQGAHGLRVHDVAATRKALTLWKALSC